MVNSSANCNIPDRCLYYCDAASDNSLTTLIAAKSDVCGLPGKVFPSILTSVLPKSPSARISWLFLLIVGSAMSLTNALYRVVGKLGDSTVTDKSYFKHDRNASVV
jgi:hypothetical protein